MGELDSGNYGRGDTAQPAPPKTPTTDEAVQGLLTRYRTNAVALAALGDTPLTQIDSDPSSKTYGQAIVTAAGARVMDIKAQQSVLEDSLNALGYNPKTTAQSADISAAERNNNARIAADERMTAARIASDEKLAAANNAAALDRTNIQDVTARRGQDITDRGQRADAVISMLDKEIARGNLDVTAAATKLRGVTDAASLERGVLADWGKYALPAGSAYFPGGEPGGSISQIAASLGLPNFSLPTGGQFQVDPSAMAAPIRAATAAVPTSQSLGIGDALARAIGTLGALGLPVDGRTGRPPGPDPMTRALSGQAA